MKQSFVNTPKAALAVLLVLAICRSILSAEDALSIELRPSNGTFFDFGELSDSHFVIRNRSTSVIVVQRIRPLTVGNEPVVISSSVYGSVRKEKEVDGYYFNGMSQRSTQLPFHRGLLLPGEQLIVKSRYRPIAKQEELRISYYRSEQTYDGTTTSMKPFRIYIPVKDKDNALSGRYIPFTRDRWKEITAEYHSIRPLGSGNSPRAVLIPDIEGKPQMLTFRVSIPYDELPFCLEDAKITASRISGIDEQKLRVAFCSSFAQYVVFQDDCSWLLSSRNQKEKGNLLTVFPETLLNDIDSLENIRVRVGDKQEGFGPDVKKSSRKFWEHYPVYYGDSMYTRGEFLHLNKGQVVEFLRLARRKGKILKQRNYFFRARYYTLAEQESAQQDAPADPPLIRFAFAPFGHFAKANQNGGGAGELKRSLLGKERTCGSQTSYSSSVTSGDNKQPAMPAIRMLRHRILMHWQDVQSVRLIEPACSQDSNR